MEGTVRCRECGQERVEGQAFCPRCGATEVATPEAPAPVRPDWRLKTAAAVLAVMALLYGVMGASAWVFADDAAQQGAEVFATLAGAPISVQVTDGDVPLSGAAVGMDAADGRHIANGTTDAGGWFNVSAPGAGAVHVNVTYNGTVWSRNVLLVDPAATVVVVDVAGATEPPGWQGADALAAVVRVLAGVVLVIAILALVAGVAAWRARTYPFVLAVAIVAALPWLMFAVATLQFASVLNLAVAGLAILFIVKSRRAFS